MVKFLWQIVICFGKEILNIFNLNFKSTKVNSIARPLMEILSGIAIGAIIFIGGSQVIMDQTTPGTFFSFLILLELPVPLFSLLLTIICES